MSLIHETAIIADGAKIHDSVEIGAYSIIGANVEIGEGCVIGSHVVIDGYTKIGKNNRIFPFAAIGGTPQDLKFKGEKSTLVIGDNNLIREYVTMHPGTEDDRMETTVGSNCLFMIGAHVAHDCVVGDRVILANNATLAGHVQLGDFVIIGGLSAVRQFVRIGAHAMIGGMSGVEHDVLPFSMVMGERAKLAGLNLVGLERRGFERDAIRELKNAYSELFDGEGTIADKLSALSNGANDNPLIKDFVEFASVKTKIGLCQPAKK